MLVDVTVCAGGVYVTVDMDGGGQADGGGAAIVV